MKYVWDEPDPNDWWDKRAEMQAKGLGEPTELWLEHLRATGRFPPRVSSLYFHSFL